MERKSKRTFKPYTYLLSTTFLFIILILLEKTDGLADRPSLEKIVKLDEHIYSQDNSKNAHPTPPLLLRIKREDGSPGVIDDQSDGGRKECHETRRLQDDNANLRRLITEKDVIIENQTATTKNLEEDLRKHPDDTKRFIEEMDNELAHLKATYFRDREGNSQLHLAAKKGDKQSVQELIQLGSDVNATNDISETPISAVATSMADSNAMTKISKYLVQHGANINALNGNSETPIILAAASERDVNETLQIIKYFIELGANVSSTDSRGETFLHKLTSREPPLTPTEFYNIADYLVSKNMSGLFNIREKKFGKTPLILAANNMVLDMRMLSLLRRNGVDFSLVDDYGKSYFARVFERMRGGISTMYTELIPAIRVMDETSVKTLVQLGADIDDNTSLYSYKDRAPLHFAAASRYQSFALNIIKLLIDFGADVDAKDSDNLTFLHILVTNFRYSMEQINPRKFHDLIVFLVSKNMSRLFKTPGGKYGSTPFQLAVYNMEIDTETLSLLENNAFETGDFRAMKTVLWYATDGNRSLRMISDLVALGADPKPLTTDKDSLLHIAAKKRNVELQKFFLDKGLDVNRQGEYGRTPLHYALHNHYWNDDYTDVFKTVQFLLKNGARSDIADEGGTTPRDEFNRRSDQYPEADMISSCLELGSLC